MQPFSGILIEYFIIGAISVVWLLPIAIVNFEIIKSFEIKGEYLALVIPLLYFLGMIFDYIGFLIFMNEKGKIENFAYKKIFGLPIGTDPTIKKSISSRLIYICAVAHEPKLAEEIELKSSRDRIARGGFIAFSFTIIISILNLIVNDNLETRKRIIFFSIMFTLILILLYFLWHRMQRLSTEYEYLVYSFLKEKYKINIPVKSSVEQPGSKNSSQSDPKSSTKSTTSDP